MKIQNLQYLLRSNHLSENWREEAERDLRVKAFSRVDDKKELEKPTKDSRERIQGARENLTLDP
jgi:hypothetical protein